MLDEMHRNSTFPCNDKVEKSRKPMEAARF
jgi:hypothetical protein